MGDTRPFVFATRGIPPDGRGADMLRESCNFHVWGGNSVMPREEMLEAVRGVEGLLVFPPDRVDRELLDAAGPQLKVIGTMSAGLEHIDLEECAKRGVLIGYTPGILTDSVAEFNVALTLAVCRRIKEGIDAVINGGWGRWENALYLSGIEIKESVIGIAGFGRIGFATAKRLKAFEPSKILYWDVGPLEYAKDVGAEFAVFEELLQNSDILIVCVSLTDGTRGLFNTEAFKKMKRSTIFINTSRGAVINQDDLYTALTTGQIRAAGLDVTTPEPLPRDSPLLSLPNCTISPHMASASEITRNAMAELTAQNIIAGLKGEKMPAPVCVEMFKSSSPDMETTRL
ncbi:hypothetical protein CHS0354_030532 [Potamilus streckersoni]|uniref:Glyoxylate reductase/hydroxypyruvate reductase n=1 Tax=Potamilus streckersoni TaxID=2493646 RepID=A0AAE0RPI3_9BIVA|nr:hypothetical protein CHS0354_030532 [Potamilus streckersoni]